jgi:hypothetical protein
MSRFQQGSLLKLERKSVLIISTLASRGIAMARLPMSVLASEFAATAVFALLPEAQKPHV